MSQTADQKLSNKNANDKKASHFSFTPEQRADLIVKRLEQFIRDGRNLSEGMSLKRWMNMARFEISNAIYDTEKASKDHDIVTKRLLFAIASAFVTIGFWGTLFAYGKVQYLVVALVLGISGFVLLISLVEWNFFKKSTTLEVFKKTSLDQRVKDLTERINHMEKKLDNDRRVLQRLKRICTEKKNFFDKT